MRFFILRGHYRSPLNYSDAQLQDAKNSLDRLYRALRGNNAKIATIDWNEPDAAVFKSAMDDDFNTPEAIAVLFKLTDEVFGGGDKADLLLSLAGTLGLLQRNPEVYFTSFVNAEVTGVSAGGEVGQLGAMISNEEIDQLIQQRTDARKATNFNESDRIRDLLAEKNIVLEDGAAGTTWRRG